MKKPGVLNINVPNQHKTSLAEAGILEIEAPVDGTRIVCIGHAYFPDHDRSLVDEILRPFLRDYKPHLIFALGGMIHDDAFQEFAPRKENRRKVAVHTHTHAPEVALANQEEAFEEKVLAFGRACGQWLTSLAEEGDSQMVYLPSASPLLPNESEIMKFLYYTKLRIDEYNEKRRNGDEEPESYLELPTHTDDYVKILGLENSERVIVAPMGAGAVVNDKVLFMVGDFRRRNPITAGITELEQRHISVVRGFDGKLADSWSTSLRGTLPMVREYAQVHEVPNLMDSQRMGYLRDYDRWAHGVFFGSLVRGELHGCSLPIIPGSDGRRAVVINGKVYAESTPGGKGKKLAQVSLTGRKFVKK